MTKDILLNALECAFPIIEMPANTEIMLHGNDCDECLELLADIEEYRGKEITGFTIMLIHKDMAILSAKTWQWILPHYLRYCLTLEAEESLMETQFLIYNLSPKFEFEAAAQEKLSLLNTDQVDCLILFLKWCLLDEHWKEYCHDDILQAIFFLNKL